MIFKAKEKFPCGYEQSIVLHSLWYGLDLKRGKKLFSEECPLHGKKCPINNKTTRKEVNGNK